MSDKPRYMEPSLFEREVNRVVTHDACQAQLAASQAEVERLTRERDRYRGVLQFAKERCHFGYCSCCDWDNEVHLAINEALEGKKDAQV